MPLSERDFLVLDPDRALQLAHVTVAFDGTCERLLLIIATRPMDSDLTLSSLFPRLTSAAGGRILVLVCPSDDAASAAVTSAFEDQNPLVAAAIAVLQASWGWDARLAMDVVVNDQGYRVSPAFDGQRWKARVTQHDGGT